MDPRPYHFEYRRPRLSNPTFQSSHLYNSIYSFKPQGSANPEYSRPYDTPPVMKRANSIDFPTKKTVEIQNVGSFRYNSKDMMPSAAKRLPSNQKSQQSKLASYGNNLMRNSSMDQTQVYERQQKPFNIINYYPRSYRPNLKQFPKLTLEDRLIQTGKESKKSD